MDNSISSYQSTVDINAVLKKIKKNAISFDGKIPFSRMTRDGKYTLGNGGGWTDGFYIGVLNLAYAISGDTEFRTLAERYNDFLKLRVQNTDEINDKYGFMKLDHDVGMIFLPSAGFGYTAFNGETDKEILLAAAEVLAERYNEKGKFIRAWDTWSHDTDIAFIEEKKGKVIIDSLLNIPLLFKAYEITGDKRYYNIAYSHAKTLSKYIVREDYSTYHTYNFNHITGEAICGKTQQGFSDESCWSRGQSWAVYGFALAYKYTGDKEFLEKSEKTAEYFMNHLNCVDLPAWDFFVCDKFDFIPWDASAATICASGLLELYDLTKMEDHKSNALRLLRAIEKFCVTSEYENCQPLVLHNTAGPVYRDDKFNEILVPAIDQASVYADYFYLECKLKLSSNKLRIF